MKQTGMITCTDATGREMDTYYVDIVSLGQLAAFVNQIQPMTHGSLNYYAMTQGVVIDTATAASTGEFDTVAQYVKIFMDDVTLGESFYHFLPAPKSEILELQRGGKRMIQAVGEQYAAYVGTLKGHTVNFKHAYLVGYKY